MISKGARLEVEGQTGWYGSKNVWFDRNNKEFVLQNFKFIGDRCGYESYYPVEYIAPDTIIVDYLTRKHIKEFNAVDSRSEVTNFYIMNGNLSMTKKFIKRGVLFTDSFKILKSPIIEACLSGNFDIFKLFVDKDFKINEETFVGQNALHFACLGGEGKIINYLISKGVDLKKRNKCERWSQYDTPQEMFQCLLKGSLKSPELIQHFFDQKINLKNSDYWYWLFSSPWNIKKSSWKNVFKAADILLKNGVSPNCQGYDLSESYKNSLYFMASSCFLNDSTAFEFSKLFVENGIKLSVLDVRKQIYPFDLLRDSYDYGCPKSYFRTVSYLLSICPYFDPWHFEYKIRKDPGEIPYRIGYFKDFYFLD